jgi:hypothetical protein
MKDYAQAFYKTINTPSNVVGDTNFSGSIDPDKWYYALDKEDYHGPFDTKLEADDYSKRNMSGYSVMKGIDIPDPK